MNKKGFTLFEVIISVVLVSILLTSMLVTLVKIRDAYSIVYENTDALIFSSSIARIVNNDFQQNGGIRYIDCNYNGDVCDITLNNDQKRRIEVYNVNTGYHVKSSDQLKYYIGTSDTSYNVSDSDNIFCEPVEHDGEMKLIAECYKATDDSTSSVACVCEKQMVTTTLRYSDQTDKNNEKNIYLKTLSAQKMSAINLVSGKYKATGQRTVNGYTFGKMTFTNIVYDSTNRKTEAGKPYKNSVSTLVIEINDGVDTQDTTYNINLSSTSSYSPDKIQMGKELAFRFDNSLEYPVGTPISGVSIQHKIKSFHIKFGVGFFVMTNDNKLEETRKLTNDNEKGQLPVTTNGSYIFDGYYYDLGGTNEMQVIDANGNIVITSTYFESDKDDAGNSIFLKAKWIPRNGGTPGNPVVNNRCTVGTTYENCLLNEDRDSSLWTVNLPDYTPTPAEYRFVGSKSSQPTNYICFGTTNSSTCTSNTDKYLYRIIGVFEEGGTKYLKLIKNSSFGTHAMDSNFNSDHRWSATSLYGHVNGSEFLNNTTYIPNTTWKNKIVSRTWQSTDTHLSGRGDLGIKLYNLTASKAYCLEYNIESCKESGAIYTNSTAKIGLMYITDYSLSLGSSVANSTATLKEQASTLKTGWMYNYTGFSNKKSHMIEWSMTRAGYPVEGLTNARFYGIHVDGQPSGAENRYGAEYRPVFYIKASEKYAGGIGTESKPFIISE